MMHSLHVASFANRSGAGKVSASAGTQSFILFSTVTVADVAVASANLTGEDVSVQLGCLSHLV